MKIYLISIIIMLSIVPIFSSVNINGENAIFSIDDKSYDNVYLASSFNSWKFKEYPLKKKNGIWSIEVPLYPGKYQYKFVINGQDWILDPENESVIKDGNFTNSYFEMKVEEKELNTKIEEDPNENNTSDNINNIENNLTYFEYTDRDAESVCVVGDFNSWETNKDMLKDHDGDGKWEGRFLIDKGTYMYMFVINGEKWYSDPNASEFSEDGYGGKNSIIQIK